MDSNKGPSRHKGWRRAVMTLFGGIAAAPAAPAAPTAPEAPSAQSAPAAPPKIDKKRAADIRNIDVETVVYKKVGGRSLSLYIARPPGQTVATRSACMVFFHGGGYIKGEADKFRLGRALSQRGVLAISVEYRLLEKKGSVPIEAIEDGRSAMRYIRSHAATLGCDPNRLAASGGSAGAHMAMMTAMKQPYDDPADDLSISPKPQALVLMSGPYNLDRYNSPLATAVSPYHIVGADLPPTLMLHGTADKTALYANAVKFREKVTGLGVQNVTLVPFPDRGHGLFAMHKSGGQDFNQAVDEIAAFFRRLGWLTVPASGS